MHHARDSGACFVFSESTGTRSCWHAGRKILRSVPHLSTLSTPWSWCWTHHRRKPHPTQRMMSQLTRTSKTESLMTSESRGHLPDLGDPCQSQHDARLSCHLVTVIRVVYRTVFRLFTFIFLSIVKVQLMIFFILSASNSCVRMRRIFRMSFMWTWWAFNVWVPCRMYCSQHVLLSNSGVLWIVTLSSMTGVWGVCMESETQVVWVSGMTCVWLFCV